jgi:hypothetical protein
MADYPKLTGFLIGILLVSLFASLFALLVIEGQRHYSFNMGNLNISKYDKLNDVSSQAQQIKSDSLNAKQQQGVFDLVGGFFSNSWKVVTSIPQSFNLFDAMATQATNDLSSSAIGDSGISVLRNTLETAVVILLFIGIILAALIKWVL